MGKIVTVYKTTNLKNNKIYIGSTTRGLKFTKFHHKSASTTEENRSKNRNSRPIYKAIKKYGFYNFMYNTMAEFESKKDAYDFKEACIVEFNAMNPKYGYNCTTGRLDKYKMNKETKEKISKIQTGKTMPDSFISYMKNRVSPLIGYKHTKKAKRNMKLGQLNSDYVQTEEIKKKKSETMKKRWKEPAIIEKMKNRKRGIVTKETRRKLSIANSGKNNSMYGRKGKLHHSYGIPLTQEHKNKISKKNKINAYNRKLKKLEMIKNRTEKKCCKCSEMLDLSMFFKTKKNLDGLSYHCKSCDKLRKEKNGTSE